jgi:hypothetical protein
VQFISYFGRPCILYHRLESMQQLGPSRPFPLKKKIGISEDISHDAKLSMLLRYQHDQQATKKIGNLELLHFDKLSMCDMMSYRQKFKETSYAYQDSRGTKHRILHE